MTIELQQGAVVMFDALGFKGIWERFPAFDIINALDTLRANAITAAANENLHVHLFSDTVALGVTVDSHADLPRALNSIVNATADIIVRAAFCDPPLIFRGCIAVGRLIATPTVLVGEAVDRAAQGHEQADAAIVWFTDESSSNWEEWGLSGKSMTIVHTEVPLKGGSVQTRAINPLAVFASDPSGHPNAGPRYDEFFDAMSRTFERHSAGPLTAAVARKRENTQTFLGDCRSYLDTLYEIEMMKLNGTWSLTD